MAAGAAAVAALFVFLRDAFGRRTAVLGALILAIHPHAVAFSSDVQSDGLYLAFFLAAVAALWRALRSGALGPAAAAGGLAGLAYGVRPEGAGLLLVGAALGALEVVRRRWSARRGLAWLGALAAAALVVMSPYLLALRLHTGAWLLTQKKSLAELSGGGGEAGPVWLPPGDVSAEVVAAHPFLETVVRGPRTAPLARRAPDAARASPLPGRHGRALWELYLATISTLRFELVPLLALGVLAPWRLPGRRGVFVIGVAGLYLVVLYSLALGAGYVSRRHALPPLVVGFGYVALGLERVGGWLAAPLARWRGPGGRPPSWLASAVGAALVLAIAAPQALQARRGERLAERRAAEWLRAQPQRGAVAAPKLRVAYYADAPYVPLPPAGAGPLLAYLRATDARYMIVDLGDLEEHRDLDRLARSAMRVVHRTEANGRSAAVFAIERAH